MELGSENLDFHEPRFIFAVTMGTRASDDIQEGYRYIAICVQPKAISSL